MSSTEDRITELQEDLNEAIQLACAEEDLKKAKLSGDIEDIKSKKVTLTELRQAYRNKVVEGTQSIKLIPPTVAAGISSINGANDTQ